jgi:hypothetical protein
MTASLSDERVFIERVFTGEDVDPARRGFKTLVARSECTFDCKDNDTLDRCIEAIKQSDENLRKRPQQTAFYDWQSPLVVRKPEGGGVLTLGVAWYDEEFFDAKREVYLNPMHNNLFDHIGIEADGISISHWKLVGQGAA